MDNLVLVAHNDLKKLEGLVKALDTAGYHCLSARDGEEALATIASYGPQLAVLTADLPAIQGTEVCLRLKQETATEHMAVILLATEGSEGDRFVGEQVGADVYLTGRPTYKKIVAQVAKLFADRDLNAAKP